MLITGVKRRLGINQERKRNMYTTIQRMTRGLIVLFTVLTCLFSAAQAQPTHKSIAEQIKILKEKLLLNEEQIKKITMILEDQREEMTIAANEHRSDQKTLRGVTQEILKKSDAKIKELLIEEQLSVYEEIMQARQIETPKKIKRSHK
jgi:hypothetical protein